MTLRPYTYIDTPAKWAQCLEDLRAQPRFAVDLEANSLFAYRERVCLLQVTTPTADYIIDPFAKIDLQPFGDLLADPRIEKIFHACEYDLILMKQEFDWDVVSLFDTMWAARILGYKNMGLANFLLEFYELTVSKKHQKANWGKRPLTESQLEYAQCDTYYLLDLRDRFWEMLEEKDCAEEATEIFSDIAKVRLPDRTFSPDGFWRMKFIREIPAERLGVLRALYVWREGEGKRRDLPVFKVMSDLTIKALTEAVPKNLNELSAIKGVSDRMIAYSGRKLVAVIAQGLQDPVPKRPRRAAHHTTQEIRDRYDRLADWRKRAAQKRGVESDVVMHRETLWEIANQNPASLEDLRQIESLGPVRLNLYGDDLLADMVPASENPD